MDFFSTGRGMENNVISFVLPYLLAGFSCFLIVRFRTQLRMYKRERAVRYGIAVCAALLELAFHIWTFEQLSGRNWRVYLIENTMFPFQVCAMAFWMMVYCCITENQKLFRFALFLAVSGPLLTILFGSVDFGLNRFRYWHFYLSHTFSLVMTFYLFFVRQMPLFKKDWRRAFLILSVMTAFIALPVNIIFGTNYMFIYHTYGSPLELISNRILAGFAAVALGLILFSATEWLFLKAGKRAQLQPYKPSSRNQEVK